MVYETLRQKARKLIATANDLLAIAHDLERSHLGRSSQDTNQHPADQDLNDDPILIEYARSAYMFRRKRNDIFDDPTLFGEPAWDILLDLFIAAKEGKRLPVTSACIGAAVPSTTALRWLTVLEERGYVVRELDKADARRIFVRLSAEGYEKMVRFLTVVVDHAPDGRPSTESLGLRMAR